MIKISSFNTVGEVLPDKDYLIGVRLNAGVYTDWKYPVSMLSFGGQGGSRQLTGANNGETLLTTDYILFLNSGPYSFPTVNMPDPALMAGKQLIFINNDMDMYENYFNLSGNFAGGGSYSLTGWQIAVTFCSDGTSWYVVNQYLP